MKFLRTSYNEFSMNINDCLKEFLKKICPSYRLSLEIKDMSIRIQDIQNRMYDAVVQNRNQSYEELNLIKLNALRQKVKNGEKIRVVFLTCFLEKFEIASVYWEMERSELFEPIIFVMSERDKMFEQFPEFYEYAKNTFNYLKEKGYRTWFAYDSNKQAKSLWDLKPDIVFYNDPQLAQFTEFPNYYINAVWLSCYTPYFMPVVKNDAYCYHNPNINSAWKVFCPTREFYRNYIDRQNINATHLYTFNGANAIFTGYPKLDSYAAPLNFNKLPKGLDNSKPMVIIAPHGNIKYDVNIATFHLYYKQLIELLEQYPNISFVFKPHPVLRRRLSNMVRGHLNPPMTPEQYDAYIQKWCSYPNGFYVQDGEYIDLFKASDLLITDSGSFISEYLPSGHPCIYLLNPENEKEMSNFTSSAQKILKTYYCCNNWDEVEKNFADIIVYHKDIKKQERVKMAEAELNVIGEAGKRIVQHIVQCVEM